MGDSEDEIDELAASAEKKLDEEIKALREQDRQVMRQNGKKTSHWDSTPEVPMVVKLLAVISILALGIFLPLASYCQNSPKEFAKLSGTQCLDEDACLSCKTILNNYFRNTIGYTKACDDGTPNNACSKTLPLECMLGELVPKAGKCGCPQGFAPSGDWCTKIE